MKITIKFLGQGVFAQPIKEVLQKRFTLVEESPDLQVVANYGRILATSEIETPKYGTINVHPSLLPKYRGATPLQSAILNGDSATGVCIIKMAEKVDAGPILACEEIAIDSDETLQTLTAKTAKLAAKMLPYLILGYISGSINPTQQYESKTSHARRLTKQDGLLDLSKPVVALERQIRAYHPWPGSFVKLRDGKRLIIHQAHLDGDRFVPDIVQLEGRKPIGWAEFVRGWRGQGELPFGA